MPQLESQFFATQIFWLLFVFTVIYAFVAVYFFPRISRIVEGRRSKVQSDLEKAEKLVAQQAELKAQTEQLLATAREDGSKIKKQSLNEAEEQIAIAIAKVEKELSKKIHSDEEKLLRLKSQMLKEIDLVSQEIAADLVQIVKKAIIVKSR